MLIAVCLFLQQVYDVTCYVTAHPGGEAILKNVGGDCSEGFHDQKAHGVVKNHIAGLLEKFYVGTLWPEKGEQVKDGLP